MRNKHRNKSGQFDRWPSGGLIQMLQGWCNAATSTVTKSGIWQQFNEKSKWSRWERWKWQMICTMIASLTRAKAVSTFCQPLPQQQQPFRCVQSLAGLCHYSWEMSGNVGHVPWLIFLARTCGREERRESLKCKVTSNVLKSVIHHETMLWFHRTHCNANWGNLQFKGCWFS